MVLATTASSDFDFINNSYISVNVYESTKTKNGKLGHKLSNNIQLVKCKENSSMNVLYKELLTGKTLENL